MARSAAAAEAERLVATIRAEAEDLAAITGETGDADDWNARASQYAALQAQILRDMQAREAHAAEEYAADANDPELAQLLGLGLGLGDDDAGIDALLEEAAAPSMLFPSTAAAPAPAPARAPATAAAAAPAAPAPSLATSQVLSAAELEAQLMGMDGPAAPAPGSGSTVSSSAVSAPAKGIPKLLSVEDMSEVPLPPGWRVGMALPPNTFLVFEDGPEGEGDAAAAAAATSAAAEAVPKAEAAASAAPLLMPPKPAPGAAAAAAPGATATAPMPAPAMGGAGPQQGPYGGPQGQGMGMGGPMGHPPHPGQHHMGPPGAGFPPGHPAHGHPGHPGFMGPPQPLPGMGGPMGGHMGPHPGGFPGMPPMPAGMPPGLLPPQALHMLQGQYQQLVHAIQQQQHMHMQQQAAAARSAKPGTAPPAPEPFQLPPAVQEQLGHLQGLLQRHTIALQYLQRHMAGMGPGGPMGPQQQRPYPGPQGQQQQPPLPHGQPSQGPQAQQQGQAQAQAGKDKGKSAAPAAAAAAADGKEQGATGAQGGRSFAEAAGAVKGAAKPTAGAIGTAAQPGVSQPPLPTGGAQPPVPAQQQQGGGPRGAPGQVAIVQRQRPATAQGQQGMGMRQGGMGPGMGMGGPRLPPGPPPPPPAPPVTMATILTAPVPPPRALQGKSRMSMMDILGVCRSLFNQLSALDPFSECYYALILQTKRAAAAAAAAEAARRAAMGLAPSTSGGAGSATAALTKGNILDVAATLTELGDKAIAAGRGKAKPGEAGHAGGAPRSGLAPTNSGGPDSEPMSAAAALIASLPVQSIQMSNIRANQADLKKLHAVKRRLWEQHNSVLGRQESANVRAPKRTLNLSETGTTTADELRDGTEHVSAPRAFNKHAPEEGGAGQTSPSNSPSKGSGPGLGLASPSGKGAGGAGGAEAAAASPAAQLWAIRARIDAAHEGILALQEAARKQQSNLRLFPPPPAASLEAGRAEVQFRRTNLGEIVGVTPSPTAEGQEAATRAAADAVVVEDGVLLAMLQLPKGKKLLARVVPMLEPSARVAVVTACMRILPYVVASATPGKDYEDADAALAAALSGWVNGTAPPAPSAATASPAPSALSMLSSWVEALRLAHPGHVIKALLQHPGASDVIATLLMRGQAEAGVAATAAEGAAASVAAGLPAPAVPRGAATAEHLQAWRDATDALGRMFVEAA